MDQKQLEAILNDAGSTAEEKAAAQAAMQADAAGDLENELLQAARKRDLAAVPYHDIHAFCSDRKFSVPAGALWDRWLFVSPVGRKGIEKMADYLREHDFNAWDSAACQWKDSDWKDSERLISVLQRIVDSPNLGNYHSEEVVAGARAYLTEVRRRAGEPHAS